MFLVLVYVLLAGLVGLVLLIVVLGMSFKVERDFESSSPFECGFDPMGVSRIPFSLRFFLVAMVFLIFDVEITLILPIPIAVGSAESMGVLLVGGVFVGVLLLGLFHEWRQGALEWAE